ncbi:MAG: guanylate kinase [Pleurocapsa sp.]
MSAGKLIVITGPSGVGKGTIVKALLKSHSTLSLSISATTRQPRPGEVEGVDYYFFSRLQFEAAIASGEFLEWAEYAGNYYGTPRSKVEAQLNQGKSVLLEIEVVGAKKIASIFPDALRIFILPPSVQELETRIRNRGTNSEASIACRLAIAKTEIAASTEFDFTIINDDLNQAIALVEAIIFKGDL